MPVREGSSASRLDSDVQVSAVQRARMFRSAAKVVSNHGYGQMTIARVTSDAGVSRRTFYDAFEDREDCFLAIFNQTLERVTDLASAAYVTEREWRARIRAALLAILRFLDDEPELAALLVVGALQAGPRVLKRRTEILKRLAVVLRETAASGRAVPALTAEGVVGALFSVIHTRLVDHGNEPLVGLLNPLMGVVVLAFEGQAAAQRELAVPPPGDARSPQSVSEVSADAFGRLPMRVTYRTLMVLSVIGGSPRASNREVGSLAGVQDQGQISRLLARLEGLGLIENVGGGQSSGEPNAWQLTSQGRELHLHTREQSAGVRARKSEARRSQ
jgi:AcrR family transcriptional regulator